MKRRWSRFAAVAAVSGVLLTGCAASDSVDGETSDAVEELSLKMSSFFPEEYPMGQLTQEWAEAIGEATEGRVTIEVFASGSLTPGNECYQGVVDGVSDL